ncbi:MAG: 4-alpha-glucanotransferase [Candidatus Omnitrophica bacterium]|jgi:4-alpha-glucanotransferase|nr:4-alpha-glucanotransferase [Candidatus Omnitrophota bacterium]
MNAEEQLTAQDSREADSKWKAIGAHKRAGILVPLFSVYSSKSTGIGDIADIRLLIDFCAKSGNSILQLLPMNEVGPLFCPYDSVSSFALEPMYLRLEDIVQADKPETAGLITELKKEFPAIKSYVDYSIKPEKLDILWKIFSEGKAAKTAGFRKFIDTNSYWLQDFALFNYLKSAHQGKAWWDWQEQYKKRDPSALKKVASDHAQELDFQMWLQWKLYEQFTDVKAYARNKSVLIKGDLPILVSRDSADVWAHPDYFKLDFVAGAPPDMYCAKGQRWGTPTYEWDRIFDDGGEYLRQKLVYAQNFYDILRIDHVVGLLRIWSIPYNDAQENKGLNGFFDPRDEKEWESHGRRILSFMLKNTDMLLCAEDLGTIPPACVKLLKELKIPGNDVQRWIKDWKVKHDFSAPSEYRQLAVSMLSTHDTTNWPAWWENEAGTIDEGLFERICQGLGIEAAAAKKLLFDPKRSLHGRLRWLDTLDSADNLMPILGRNKDQLWQVIDLYENSYKEKEKLWKILGMKGNMKEKADKTLINAIMKFNLDTASIFCINLITDVQYVFEAFAGDPYQFRINTPGTVADKNWSLTMPLDLDELQDKKYTTVLKKMIESSGRE